MISRPAIVLVTTSFPISGDGSEAAGSFVADLAEELSKHLPVRVVAPGVDDRQEAWCEGVEVYRYSAPAQALSTLQLWNPMDILKAFRVLRAGQAATWRAVTAGTTSHVLALWALPCGYWARQVSRKLEIPYSVWTLGSDIWSLGRIPLVRGYLRRVLRDARYCYSDGIKLAEDTHKLGRKPVEFLASTRRIDERRSVSLKSAPPYKLLFLGRWHPNKGIDILLEALALLGDADWQRIESVEICGGGPLESAVRARVEELWVRGRPVKLRGFLDSLSAQEAIIRSDFLLIPSRIESIPVVFSDAMKLKCPVVATPVGDLGSLFNAQVVGLLATNVSSESYAEAVSLATLCDLSKFELGMEELSANFDLEKICERIVVRLHTT